MICTAPVVWGIGIGIRSNFLREEKTTERLDFNKRIDIIKTKQPPI